jgi:tetratricopeptide (TPR) repeat protein
MFLHKFSIFASLAASALLLATTPVLLSQASSSSTAEKTPQNSAQMYAKEKAPSLVDPAGPAISLVNSETLFTMAAALNICGYDEGLGESDPIRQHIRDEMNQALAGSEPARVKRDRLCLFIAQHRMTGTVMDVSQYISLALYLTPPPEMETSVELPEMPPDSTQVVEVLPLLRDFAAVVGLHDIWLTTRHNYDEEVNRLHDSLTQMIVSTNFYLKMPASTYDGRRFLVVVEPQLSPRTINARIYGADFVVIVSPVNGQIRMADVRHTYLHYIIEPLLYSRATAMDRFLPILKDVREAPLDFLYRSDIVSLTIECLIKAIEARTMDTEIAPYVVPPDAKRSDFERIEHDKGVVQAKMEQVRQVRVHHDMTQGWVLTQYLYDQLINFEKDPASLKDTIGELVYSMDVEHEDNRAKHIEFDREADGDVLRRSTPRKLTGLDLAEARLAAGDVKTASAIAQESLRIASADQTVDVGRANFILARTAIMTGQPELAITDFQKAIALSKETRIQAWSHIYLGRMLDLDCRRDAAVGEYKGALEVRDGQQDTRLAAERGVKTAYAVNGHSCDATDSDDDSDGPAAKPDSPKAPNQPRAPGEDPVAAPK